MRRLLGVSNHTWRARSRAHRLVDYKRTLTDIESLEPLTFPSVDDFDDKLYPLKSE